MPTLLVPSIILPAVLPTAAAVHSFNDDYHSYDPIFWELVYEARRYLARASEGELLVDRNN